MAIFEKKSYFDHVRKRNKKNNVCSINDKKLQYSHKKNHPKYVNALNIVVINVKR